MGEARRDPKSPQYLAGRDFRSRSLGDSFRHAWDGLRYIYVSQRNMRIHVFLASMVFAACIAAGVKRTELFMVALAVLGVLTAEVVNTLTEALVDLMKPEYSVFAKLIKDVAAAGVLLTAVFSVVIGAVVFFPVLGNIPDVLEGFVNYRWRYFLAHVVLFVLPSFWGILHFAGSDGEETGLTRGNMDSGTAHPGSGGTDISSGGAGAGSRQEEK